MKRVFQILCVVVFLAGMAHGQTSGSTPPPPPVCSQSNAGALYTDTGTSPSTVYTCSYYNLAWQWIVNPSYGGITYFPTLPSTCSGAFPVFESGWPNTAMYICVNGFPEALGSGGGGSISINGAVVPSANLNGTTPTADAGYTAGIWKVSGSNAIVEVPTATAGVTSLNGETGAVAVQGDSTITVTPSGQNIDLHVSASGVIAPNPSTTNYIVLSSSLLMDDNHVLGPTIASTATSCNGAACTVTASNTLAVGDWITAAYATGWPAIASGIYGDGLSEYQVASATSTQFTFNAPVTLTLGSVNYYGANFWAAKLAQQRQYLNGHGTILHYDLGGTCANAVTNYATYVHPHTTAVTGQPSFVIVNDCHDDFAGGASAATVEGYVQTLSTDAHTDGATFIVASPWSQQYSCVNCSLQSALFAEWLLTFKKAYNSPAAQFADGIMPLNSALNNALDSGLFYSTIGFLNPGGSQRFADEFNNYFVTFGTLIDKDTPWMTWAEDGPVSSFGLIVHPPQDSSQAFNIENAAHTQDWFYVDSTQGITHAQRMSIGGNGNNDALDVGTTGTSYVNINQFHAPSLQCCYPSNGGAFAQYNQMDVGGGGNNNGTLWQFYNRGVGSATNNISYIGTGMANPWINYVMTGEIDMPNQAPATGGPDCLQISSTGQITNTGSPCGAALNNGVATLAAGTVTVSTTGACAVGASCNYQLTHCVAGGTLGTLSVGTVTAGTSFVINSSSSTDTSQVCWRIN